MAFAPLIPINVSVEEAKRHLAEQNKAIADFEVLLAQKKAARDETARRIAEAEKPVVRFRREHPSKRGNPAHKVAAAIAIHGLMGADPTRRFTQGEIVKETGLLQPTVARALKKLVAAGTVTKQGNLYSYP